MKALVLAVGALVSLLAGCGTGSDPPSRFDGARALRDVAAQVAIGPRPSGSVGAAREVRFIAGALRDAGVEAVRVQWPLRNVVGVIPGSAPGAVVIGAHHDTKDDVGRAYVGANDGGSGVAVVLELARALAADGSLPGPSIRLALFDGEEARGARPFSSDGARGSRQYATYAGTAKQGAPELTDIRAMILFDMVGDCDLQIPREANSDPGLYAEFEAAAGGPAQPFGGEAPGILDDHIPFAEAGIPALNVIDFRYGEPPSPGSLWHTEADTLDKVCAESLDAVGEAALIALGAIGHE